MQEKCYVQEDPNNPGRYISFCVSHEISPDRYISEAPRHPDGTYERKHFKMVNGKIEIDFAKYNLMKQADEQRRVDRKALVQNLIAAGPIIDASDLQDPIKTLLKQIIKHMVGS